MSESTARWSAIGACATGASHVSKGIPCQDSAGWVRRDDGGICIAVADGAGSAAHSGVGSFSAIEAVLEIGSEIDLDSSVNPGHDVFERASERLRFVSRARGIPMHELSTTLVFVVIDGNGVAVVGQIGDSFAVRHNLKGATAISPPVHEGYANETTFLTGRDAVNEFRTDTLLVNAEDTFVLFSDGLRLRAMDKPALGIPHQPFYGSVASFVRQPASTPAAVGRYLQRLGDAGTGDDLTLVLAAMTEREVGPPYFCGGDLAMVELQPPDDPSDGQVIPTTTAPPLVANVTVGQGRNDKDASRFAFWSFGWPWSEDKETEKS